MFFLVLILLAVNPSTAADFVLSGQTISGNAGGSYLHDVALGPGDALIVTDNTFDSIAEGALRATGFGSLLFRNNTITNSGGGGTQTLDLFHLTADTSLSGESASNYIVTGNTHSGGSAATNTSVFTLAGPFEYGNVTNNELDGSVAYGIRLASFVSGAAEVGSDTLAKLRYVATLNPVAKGSVGWIVGGDGVLPNEDEVCNNICPETLSTYTSPSVITVDLVREVDITFTELAGAIFDLTVNTESERDVRPVVTFTNPTAVNLRERDSCSSVPETVTSSEPWDTVCNASFVYTANGWSITNTSSVPANDTYKHTVSRQFTLAELTSCTEFNGTTSTVASVDVAGVPTYSFDVCVGFYSCNNWGDESQGAEVFHKSCTTFQIALFSDGSAVSRFSTAILAYEAKTLSTNFNTTTNQLSVVVRTRINHANGPGTSRLVNPVATSPALTWTVGDTVCTGANSDSDSVCEQIWTATTTTGLVSESVVIDLSIAFQLEISGVVVTEANPIRYDILLRTARTASVSRQTVIGTSVSSFIDSNATQPYTVSSGAKLITGESIYVRVEALAPDVMIDITDVIMCCGVHGDRLLDYSSSDPLATGCASRGAGIVFNTTIFNAIDNTPYEDTYASLVYSLPGMDANTQMFRTKITPVINNANLMCAVQLYHHLYDLANPNGITLIPRQLGNTIVRPCIVPPVTALARAHNDLVHRAYRPVKRMHTTGPTADEFIETVRLAIRPTPPVSYNHNPTHPAGTGSESRDGDSFTTEDWLGLGISLGVIFVLAIGIILWVKHKRREMTVTTVTHVRDTHVGPHHGQYIAVRTIGEPVSTFDPIMTRDQARSILKNK